LNKTILLNEKQLLPAVTEWVGGLQTIVDRH